MNPLSVVPAAYWTQLPAWLVVAIAVLVAVLCSPFAVRWWQHRSDTYVTREESLIARQGVLDRLNADLLRDARQEAAGDRSDFATFRREAEEHIKLLAKDRDDGWDFGRGMEDVAHEYRHESNHRGQMFNLLLGLVRAFLAGDLPIERLRELVATKQPFLDSATVSKLRDVPRRGP